jgi:photosystem II stability/assembly factor-like uncharacterized protein
MLALATPLLGFALAAAVPAAAAYDGWIPASLDGECDVTDIDFSDDLHGFATCAFGNAMTTDDGGLTWSVFDTGLRQSLVFARAAGTNELYAARLGLYRSADRGQHWEEVGHLSDNVGYTVFDVHFGANGHLVADQGGTILTSDDGGANWTLRYPETQGVYLFELDFPSESIGYATGGISDEWGTSGSLLRTEDAGVTWSLLEFTHGEITAAEFLDDTHGILATQPGELYSTADGGTTWTLIGPAPNGDHLMELALRDAQHWYAVSWQGCLYETHNAGTDWETGYCDTASNPLSAITLRGDAAVAAGSGGIVLVETATLAESRIFKDGLEDVPPG